MLLALMLTLSLGAGAQTAEYRQTTRQLIELGTTSSSPSQLKATMKKAFGTMLPQAQVDALFDTLLGEYFESGELLDDLAAAIAPSLNGAFTQDDLNAILSKYGTAEGKTALAVCNSCNGLTDAMTSLVQGMTQIAQGGEAPAVERVQCPEAYRALFNQYIALAQGAAMERVKTGLAAQPKLLAYMQEALPETILRALYPATSEADLRTATTFFSDPLLQRYITHIAQIDEHALDGINQKIMQKVQAAMGAQ